MNRILLAAALISLPVTGALAEGDRGGYGFDETQTSQVSSFGFPNSTNLDSALRAAETNLDVRVAEGVRPDVEIQVRSEIRDIRAAASQDKQSNGGELSASALRTLSDRLNGVQRTIYSAR
jgi:hypothetical protein